MVSWFSAGGGAERALPGTGAEKEPPATGKSGGNSVLRGVGFCSRVAGRSGLFSTCRADILRFDDGFLKDG